MKFGSLAAAALLALAASAFADAKNYQVTGQSTEGAAEYSPG